MLPTPSSIPCTLKAHLVHQTPLSSQARKQPLLLLLLNKLSRKRVEVMLLPPMPKLLLKLMPSKRKSELLEQFKPEEMLDTTHIQLENHGLDNQPIEQSKLCLNTLMDPTQFPFTRLTELTPTEITHQLKFLDQNSPPNNNDVNLDKSKSLYTSLVQLQDNEADKSFNPSK